MIRRDDAGRYCLNDLHRASGGADKDQPTFFMRRAETAALVKELGACADSHTPIQTVNDGINNGTYVTELLVIAYAAWISAAVRVITRDGEPWVVAADIAATLNYRNAPDMTRMLDEDEKGTQTVRTLALLARGCRLNRHPSNGTHLWQVALNSIEGATNGTPA